TKMCITCKSTNARRTYITVSYQTILFTESTYSIGLGTLTCLSYHSNNYYLKIFSFDSIICRSFDIYKHAEINISHIQYERGNKKVNSRMACGCYGGSRTRSFLIKEECVALLKEYQDELEKEKQGVTERIK